MLTEVSHSFRAMNTDVEAVVCVQEERRGAAELAVRQVQGFFERVEMSLTRFMAGSELSRLNASAGRPFRALPPLFAVVKAALRAAKDTDGLFDPTVLAALLEAGYDRSFDELSEKEQAPMSGWDVPFCSWRDIRLDESTSTISMPFHCGIDLGGIAKGWSVDRACYDLKAFPGYAVDAGGDISVGGTRTDGSQWTVGVADPRQPDHNLAVLGLSRGAVCTSSTARRHWLRAGERQHHIIDPRTGKPSRSDVISATVTAPTAVQAETWTKAAILLGGEAGMHFIESHGATGLLVLEDGHILRSPGLPEVQRVA